MEPQTLLDNEIKTDGQIIRLKSGMNVTSEIKTGKRCVIEYPLSPVMKYLNESMRERKDVLLWRLTEVNFYEF